MKKYKAVFFDWDGTAVQSRKADATEVISAMKTLLQQGVYLIVVSGTTYNNICMGELEHYFTPDELKYLFLGLARGNYNYAFDEQGHPYLWKDATPNQEELIALHEVAFLIHKALLVEYSLLTDIIFSRANYCKIDLMVANARSSNLLFVQEGEIERIQTLLKKHHIEEGLRFVVKYAEEIANSKGLTLKATTDAKYLEVGYTTKSDNIKSFMKLMNEQGIDLEDCCFWGDEFGAISQGIWGSDSQMITEETKTGEFFSVSDFDIPLPKQVQKLGGGVARFLEFLKQLGETS